MCLILAVEPNRLFEKMIRQAALLTFSGPNLHVVTRVSDADHFLAHQRADILILATEAPDGDVIDRLNAWLREPTRVDRVLIVTGRRDERIQVAIHALPIHGVIDRTLTGVDEFAQALRLIAGGGRYWSSSALQHAEILFDRNAISRRLTPTQLVVFALIGGGYNDAEIGNRLKVSEFTVESTRRELRSLLNVKRQCDLVVLAVQHGYARLLPDRVEIPGYLTLISQRASRQPRLRTKDTVTQDGCTSAGD